MLQLDAVGDAGALPRAPGDRGPLLGHVAAQQPAVGGEPARDAQRRVAGERADLDRRARAEQPREHREERALLGRDLHARDRAERARLVDQRELHRVGRRAVPDEVRRRAPRVRRNDLGATRASAIAGSYRRDSRTASS